MKRLPRPGGAMGRRLSVIQEKGGRFSTRSARRISTMLADRYDLPLSTVSAAARDAYVQGCDWR